MEKIRNILFLYFPVILFVNCASNKIGTVSTQVVALSGTEDGTISIRSTGQGNKEADAVKTAEIRAFNTLIFYGLTSSVQTRPMVENESEVKKKHASFFDNFFEKGGYKNFIVSSSTSTSSQKAGKYIYLNRDIKINLRSLRTNLETNNIIRKFGY